MMPLNTHDSSNAPTDHFDNTELKSSQKKLKNYAIKLLARREYTQAELDSKLNTYAKHWLLPRLMSKKPLSDKSRHKTPLHGYSDDSTLDETPHAQQHWQTQLKNTIDALLLELKHSNYQSDARASQAVLRSALHKGKGRRAIIHTLNKKQTDDASVYEQLASIDWLRQAVLAREKRFGDQKPTEAKDKARQLRFLQYRGFEADICYKAIATSADELD